MDSAGKLESFEGTVESSKARCEHYRLVSLVLSHRRSEFGLGFVRAGSAVLGGKYVLCRCYFFFIAVNIQPFLAYFANLLVHNA